MFSPSIVTNPVSPSITTVAPLGIVFIVISSERPLIFIVSMYSSAVIVNLHGVHLFPFVSKIISFFSCHEIVTSSLNQYPVNLNDDLYLSFEIVFSGAFAVINPLNFLRYPSSVKTTPFCRSALKSLICVMTSSLSLPLKSTSTVIPDSGVYVSDSDGIKAPSNMSTVTVV